MPIRYFILTFRTIIPQIRALCQLFVRPRRSSTLLASRRPGVQPMMEFACSIRFRPARSPRRAAATVPILGACLELGAASPRRADGAAGAARPPASPVSSPTSATGSPTAAPCMRSRPSRSTMDPRYAARCRHLGEIAGWTRCLHDYAYAHGRERRRSRWCSAATIRSRWARSAASPAAAASRGASSRPLARRPRRLQHPRDDAERQHARHGARLPGRRAEPPADPRQPALLSGRRRRHPRSSARARSIRASGRA